MLTLQIKEKEIENLTPEEEFVRGTVGAKCQINFDEFWQSYNKYIVFKRVGYEPINFMVDTLENEIEIPYTILAESGEFKIGVFGTTETETLPTLYSKDIKILYGTDTHGTTPPTYIPSEIDQLRLSKQDRLVSGENIKTVNGESVLGLGNIKIQVEVDQTYDPDSTNAQSGKAVDEALSAEQNRADNIFANALKGSKSGGAFLIDDVSPVTHEMGVKVKSKNLIPYPYTNTTKTQNGITFTDNGDGSITISGKAERDTYFYLCTVDFGSTNMWNESVNNNGYYVSGCKHFFYNGNNKISVIIVPSGTDYSTNPITVKPQIELGTTATDYTPYVDLTAVKVRRCGKNLFNNNKLSEWGLTLSDGKYTGSVGKLNSKTLFSSFKSNTRYTISVKASNLSKSSATLLVAINYTDGTTQTVIRVNSTTESVYSFTSTANKSISNITSTYYEADTINIAYIQIEEGTIATEYEPYKGADYTPTADGTVNGVTSLYPNTTLMTDTDGVLIDCEYNRDINKFSGADVDVPTKTSELINDSNFATQDYVDAEIANFDFIKIVTELPATGLVNRTYFVPKQDPNTNDLYDEYMWVDGKWELITTKQIEVDLTEYVKYTEPQSLTSQQQTQAQSNIGIHKVTQAEYDALTDTSGIYIIVEG